MGDRNRTPCNYITEHFYLQSDDPQIVARAATLKLIGHARPVLQMPTVQQWHGPGDVHAWQIRDQPPHQTTRDAAAWADSGRIWCERHSLEAGRRS